MVSVHFHPLLVSCTPLPPSGALASQLPNEWAALCFYPYPAFPRTWSTERVSLLLRDFPRSVLCAEWIIVFEEMIYTYKKPSHLMFGLSHVHSYHLMEDNMLYFSKAILRTTAPEVVVLGHNTVTVERKDPIHCVLLPGPPVIWGHWDLGASLFVLKFFFTEPFLPSRGLCSR